MKTQTTATPHPSIAELEGFALGSLDATRAAIVEGHVYRCDRCADLVAKVPSDEFLQQLRTSAKSADSEGNARAPGVSSETIGLPIDCVELEELPREIREHPRYEIKRLVAEGAMGRVYMARKRGSGECVAIKIMRPDVASEGRKVERFLQESRIAAKLLHPNIARVLDCESTGRSALIAMEFVRGKTLAQIVRQRGPLPVDDAGEYARQAALGLAYAADRGVVHRDIKPQNLMFEPRLRLVKIVDFGLGRLVDEQRNGSRLTRPEEILGTLDYISPEQAANSRDADVRSDIYSLGCALYFLLAGAPPFAGKNAVDLLRKHESEMPVPIRSLRRDIPHDIANLIDWALQKDPKLRPQSPRQILDYFDRCIKNGARNRLASDGSLLSANNRRSKVFVVFCWVRSPIVWLPVLTFLACIMWLLFR